MGITQLGIAIPNFWFAMILVLIFAINLRWFSAGGFPGWDNPLLALKSLTLPAIALALPQADLPGSMREPHSYRALPVSIVKQRDSTSYYWIMQHI